MIFELDTEAIDMQNEVILALGTEEILNQLTEECGELIQAAQKVRRAMAGTTHIRVPESLISLQEETADALLCIDCLEAAGIIDAECVKKIMDHKNKRWYARVIGK